MGMANPETVVVAPEATYYTADMVRALNEVEEGSTRYECVYGELVVSPGPAGLHQIVVSRILERLFQYVRVHALPYFVLGSQSDISWGRDDVTVQPDTLLIDREEAKALHARGPWSVVKQLPLAVEVISPSSRTYDRFKKRKLYQNEGVPVYWIVDPDMQLAEVWTPDVHFPTIERERLVWHPEGAAEPLVITLAELFAEP
jgi:Uma2 family endonuclease